MQTTKCINQYAGGWVGGGGGRQLLLETMKDEEPEVE
jgi:hypothetical protein